MGKLSKKATENKSFIVEMNNSTKEVLKIDWSRLADKDDNIPEGITSKADNVAQGNPSKTDNAALRGILNKSIGKKKLENLAAKGIKQHKINSTPNLTSARNKEETGNKESPIPLPQGREESRKKTNLKDILEENMILKEEVRRLLEKLEEHKENKTPTFNVPTRNTKL